MDMRYLPALALGTMLLAAGSGLSGPLPLVFEHTYDDIGGSFDAVGSSYTNAVYDPGVVVVCEPELNSPGYPPTTGACLAADLADGRADIGLTVPATRVEGDFVTGPVEINPAGVTLIGYAVSLGATGILQGGDLVEVARTEGCISGFGASVHCVLESESLPMTKVVIHDNANFWGMDSLVFTT